MSEAALASLFEKLLDKLINSDMQKIFQQEKVDADLKKWKISLAKVCEVLDDAEERQMTNRSVKIWLDVVEDLAFDADDILDEFATEALRRELNGESSTSKVRKFIPACCVGFNPNSVVNMRSKIADINTRLQGIIDEANFLDLRGFSAGSRTIASRVPTTSLVNETHVYGRDEDKSVIVNMLLSGDSREAQYSVIPSVIPIVGMGGLGKTTLAQLAYNDDKVDCHFDFKAWVCVSEDFDITRVTKQILVTLTLETCVYNDLDVLQVKLKDILFGKKFLIILDDVWNEDYDAWTKLRAPLEFGAVGSNIIVTTRNYTVASVMRTTQAFELKELSNEACLQVFMEHASWATNFNAHPELEEINKEILDRCNGSPLAAKVLGGLLRSRHFLEWKYVLNSESWDIRGMGNDILPILKMSYKYLPSHLKRCLAYFSLFPKDYEFKEKELVLLWMAEGLIPKTKDDEPMEVLGRQYFCDLFNRSFFKQSSNDESLFVMHDLNNDLAQWAAGGSFYGLDDKLRGNKNSEISRKIRHFSNIGCDCESITTFEVSNLDTALRTLLLLSTRNRGYLTNYVPNCLLPKLRCLRILSLSGYDIVELPSSICDLEHLRYLNLSRTKIRELPESTCSLYNLQTIILEGCSHLTMLPEKIGNLVNLRLLDITGADRIKGIPRGIKELKSLRTLSDFVVGKDSVSKIGDLMNLKYLQGRLCISSLENVLNGFNAKEANLDDKKHLETLVMKWGLMHDELHDPRVAIDVLNMLQPCTSLKELVIEGYGGAKFPNWLGHPSFSNMVLLRIQNCGKCTSLPEIGQLPCLKDLFIMGMGRVRSIGDEFYGDHCLTPFRSLERLHFKNMEEWQEWIPLGIEYQVFPCLQELSIFQCPKLCGKLPNHLPSLEKLVVDGCEQLTVSFPSLPMLYELKIVGCKNLEPRSMEWLHPLKSMVLCIPRLKIMAEEYAHGLAMVECLTIKDCKVLTSFCQDKLKSLVMLDIVSCPRLVDISLPSMLRTMNIVSCCALKSLHAAMMWSKCTCLENLAIVRCDSLTSISRGQLPPTLKRIKIYRCENLKFVVDEEGASSSYQMNEENLNSNNNSDASVLEHLEIRDCPSLKCFSSSVDLPATLKYLMIDRCLELTSLSSKDLLPMALKHLSIQACQKLESVVDKFRNVISLERLQIWECEKLKSLPKGLHKLCHLSVINISGCSSLVSFPDEGLLPISLSKLLIENCEKLKALPNGMHKLTSLHVLSIKACPNIIFPEEGFPTSLTSLKLLEVNICKQLFDWGLHRFTSLGNLSIGGGCPDWQSFPPEEEDGEMMVMLPTSLTRLKIKNFPNIVFLCSKGFQNLSALTFLLIRNCPELASLPEKGLPPSLLQLHINECPVLKQHCKKGKWREWFQIANIPRVLIDGRSVYELEDSK